MARVVDIADLTPVMITRGRGEQAYAQLRELLQAGEQVELRLFPGRAPISLSFLDGIIVKLVESRHLEDVTFATNDARTMHKLSNIGTIRSIPLSARWDGDSEYQTPSGASATISPRKPQRAVKRKRPPS